jgi:hypothetical protein
MVAARECISKCVPVATDMRMVLSAWAVLRSYKEDNRGNEVSSVWESMKKRVSWKGATIQRGLEHGN